MNVYKIKVSNKKCKAFGTCFSISENKLLTASHIILENSQILVLINNAWFSCKLIKKDQRLDLAIIQINMCMNLIYYQFDYIINGIDIHSYYYTEDSINIKYIEGSILKKNKVSDYCIDSTIVDFSITPGASGCPIINSKNSKIIGILCWSNDKISGGCVSRLIYQFIQSSTIQRYSLDCLFDYRDDHAIVIKSHNDDVDINTIIYKVNGINVGKRFVSIESIVYFSSADVCNIVKHYEHNKNAQTEIHVNLKNYENCKFVNDKPWTNITYLDEAFLRHFSD